MTEPKPFVDIRNAQKSYGALEVLKDISLQVARGEIVAIIGPSGSGKSTLLRAINDLDPLTGGEVWLEDTQINKKLPHRQYEKHINQVRQNIGMVFQHFNLFPHLSVRENVTLAPKAREAPVRGRGRGTGARAAGKGGADRPDRLLPLAPVGRPETARGHRACAGDEAQGHALRRGDLGARPRTGRGGEPGDEEARRGTHDHDHRHPRDGLCRDGLRPGDFHGQGRRGGGGTALQDLPQPR